MVVDATRYEALRKNAQYHIDRARDGVTSLRKRRYALAFWPIALFFSVIVNAGYKMIFDGFAWEALRHDLPSAILGMMAIMALLLHVAYQQIIDGMTDLAQIHLDKAYREAEVMRDPRIDPLPHDFNNR